MRYKVDTSDQYFLKKTEKSMNNYDARIVRKALSRERAHGSFWQINCC